MKKKDSLTESFFFFMLGINITHIVKTVRYY